MTTAADALLSALASRSVDVLFHLPGVETLPVTERAPGSRVRPVMVAHEQAAAFGAFGYARVSGRPGSSTGTWAAEDVFPVYRPHGFLTPEVLKELGSAIMVGIGAKLAAPERPVVVIQGDGGFLFQVGELATIVRENIPVVIVIFDDGYYNADRLLLEHMFRGDPAGCTLRNPDFVALGRSFGLEAVRAETLPVIEREVAAALRSGRPTLIDIPIDPAPVPYRLEAVFTAMKGTVR